MSEDFEEAKKVEDEIRQRAKLALFDLYDRCLYPIARIISVKYRFDVTKHGGDCITVEVEGQKLCSSHFEAIKNVAEEVLKKPVNLTFTIAPQGKV